MNIYEMSEQASRSNNYWLEHFAALVAAAARADEREACAKLCDNRVEELYVSRDTVDCAEWLANEIRARGRT